MATKKKICFAGFSGEELSALQTVTQTDGIWECRFVPDADAALALLAGENHDVCVASLAMPGKNGAELLGEAGTRHPQMLGFIAADVADQARIIAGIGGPHQFIRRPFTAADLVATVQRGLKLNGWLAVDEMRRLLARLPGWPALPATYLEMARKMEAPGTTSHDIADVLERDPLLGDQLLQIVNISGLAPQQRVTEPADAVALLGLPAVKSLALGLPLFHPNDNVQAAGLSLETLWEHSFLVAKYARQITLKQTGNARLADEAFTAGLLHDAGRIIMAAHMPAEYAAALASARQKSCPLQAEETAQFGFDHARAGAGLLAWWGMPAPFLEAAAAHHAPGQSVFAGQFTLLTAVSAANVFAHSGSGQTDGLPRPELDLAYYWNLKLEEQLVVWRRLCTGELAMAAKTELVAETVVIDAVKKPRPPESKLAPVLALAGKLAGAAVLAAAGIWAWPYLKPHLAPAHSPPPSDKPDAPAAANPGWEMPASNLHKNTPPPVSNRWDTVRVDGIFYRTAKSMALINDQALHVGDSISGFKVIAIHPNSVTISNNGEQRECSINVQQ